MTLSKLFRKDKQYEKLQRIVKTAKSRIDIEKIFTEASSLHSSLEVRQLYGKNVYNTKKVLQATAQLQANRSRLVELQSTITEHTTYVSQAILAFKRHCLANYDFDGFKTKDAREAVMDKSLRPALQFISEVDNLIDNIDLFIKDIDQAGFSIRHIVEVLKLLDSSKVGVNI